LTPAGLRGKVVLIDFWTYSCINWRRSFPYVRAWARTYAGQGLVVIGVHSPEFDFEKDLGNVRRAAGEIGVDVPIAVDSDHAIWRAFGNEYWPAIYLVDARGKIRYHQFGEGDYDTTEAAIRQLLAEINGGAGAAETVRVTAAGVEAAPDWDDLNSPETYLGSARAERRAHGAPARLGLNQWALTGDWTIRAQAARLNEPGGRIAFRFHARDLHLVMGPAARDASVRFRVLLDGRPPGAAHGADVDAAGYGAANQQRLFQLIRAPKPVADRTFEIEFLDSGVEAYSFTFG
jgi:thiol-disulfide isomerase/thioredoxin